MGTSLKRTIKHDVIKAWATSRHGVPARVNGTTDALSIKIGDDEKQYVPIEWTDWLERFDTMELAFVYEDPGYSCKVVARNGHEDAPPPEPTPVAST